MEGSTSPILPPTPLSSPRRRPPFSTISPRRRKRTLEEEFDNLSLSMKARSTAMQMPPPKRFFGEEELQMRLSSLTLNLGNGSSSTNGNANGTTVQGQSSDGRRLTVDLTSLDRNGGQDMDSGASPITQQQEFDSSDYPAMSMLPGPMHRAIRGRTTAITASSNRRSKGTATMSSTSTLVQGRRSSSTSSNSSSTSPSSLKFQSRRTLTSASTTTLPLNPSHAQTEVLIDRGRPSRSTFHHSHKSHHHHHNHHHHNHHHNSHEQLQQQSTPYPPPPTRHNHRAKSSPPSNNRISTKPNTTTLKPPSPQIYQGSPPPGVDPDPDLGTLIGNALAGAGVGSGSAPGSGYTTTSWEDEYGDYANADADDEVSSNDDDEIGKDKDEEDNMMTDVGGSSGNEKRKQKLKVKGKRGGGFGSGSRQSSKDKDKDDDVDVDMDRMNGDNGLGNGLGNGMDEQTWKGAGILNIHPAFLDQSKPTVPSIVLESTKFRINPENAQLVLYKPVFPSPPSTTTTTVNPPPPKPKRAPSPGPPRGNSIKPLYDLSKQLPRRHSASDGNEGDREIEPLDSELRMMHLVNTSLHYHKSHHLTLRQNVGGGVGATRNVGNGMNVEIAHGFDAGVWENDVNNGGNSVNMGIGSGRNSANDSAMVMVDIEDSGRVLGRFSAGRDVVMGRQGVGSRSGKVVGTGHGAGGMDLD
ncbi:hypothetical protein HDU76_005589 [Blyttiomyces sp. JEL0837]|nr:hypothetical protein HDU76_005589 [Blyttiomyces sp. JEL0837]